MTFSISRPQLTVGDLKPGRTYKLGERQIKVAVAPDGSIVISPSDRLLVDLETGELLRVDKNHPLPEYSPKETPFSQISIGPFIFRERPWMKLHHGAEKNAVCLIDGSLSNFHGRESVELLAKLDITTL